MKVCVIGSGSWGTAICVPLSDNGHEVSLWGRDPEKLSEIDINRENKRYLPGVRLPDAVRCEADLGKALEGASLAVFAVPAQHFASTFEKAAAIAPDLLASIPVVNLAKGIEQKSLKRLSERAFEILPDARYVVLSGPSHAEEAGRRLATTVAVASGDAEAARLAQDALMTDYFRIYTNEDVTGVELGGALKNVMALGVGISDGLGCGDNAKAALMTRGLTEMIRLGMKLGADPNTFSGLSGMGDLIVTCCSEHSRNHRCGVLIGRGTDAKTAEAQIGMVVEGMYTAAAARALARQNGVEMPITEVICGILEGSTSPAAAMKLLMTRSKKRENEDILKRL